MKIEVELEVPVTVTVKVEIDATKSEIRELYDLDRDDDVEDYYVDYVNDHRHHEIVDDMNLDSINVSFDSSAPSRNIKVDVASQDIDVIEAEEAR
tara:strand:- start:32 stop:316 length:285 start_codon:yes stop_codon:yes gene_type:complete